MGSNDGQEAMHHVQFEVLTSTNYDSWAAKMEMTLNREGLLPIVEKKPDEVDLKDSTWIAKNLRAKSFICIALPTEMVSLANSVVTAYEMWVSLGDMSKDSSFRTLVGSWQKLCEIRMQDSNSVDEHIQLMKVAIGAVNVGLGVELAEIFQVLLLVRSMSPKFDELKEVLMSQGRMQTWESVVSQIRNADLSRKAGPAIEEHILFKSRPTIGVSKSDPFESGPAIEAHGLLVIGKLPFEPRLIKSSSPSNTSSSGDSVSSTRSQIKAGAVLSSLKDVKCSYCGDFGHKARACKKRSRDQKEEWVLKGKAKVQDEPQSSAQIVGLTDTKGKGRVTEKRARPDAGGGLEGTSYPPKQQRTREWGEVRLANILQEIVSCLVESPTSYWFKEFAKNHPSLRHHAKEPKHLGTINRRAIERRYKSRHDFRYDMEEMAGTVLSRIGDGWDPEIASLADMLLQHTEEELFHRAAELQEAEEAIHKFQGGIPSKEKCIRQKIELDEAEEAGQTSEDDLSSNT